MGINLAKGIQQTEMKIIVFGASGRTGKEVVRQRLEASHIVAAFVRGSACLTIQHRALRVAAGDAPDSQSVSKAVAGQEAAVVALGSNDRNGSTARSQGTANIIRAVQEHRVLRLAVFNDSGTGDSTGQLRVPLKPLFRRNFHNAYLDHELQEAYVRDSGLKWAISRPATLTSDPLTGRYKIYRPDE